MDDLRGRADIVAMPAAGHGVGSLGAIVWWELNGPVKTAELIDALKTRGIVDHLPIGPTPAQALWRAAESQVGPCLGQPGSQILLRPLRVRGAWELVREAYDEPSGHNRYEWLVRGGYSDLGVELEHNMEVDRGLADSVRGIFPVALSRLSTADVSSWLLVYTVHWLDVVGLRARGGFYFIPADKVGLWSDIVGAIRSCSSHEFHAIPAVRSDEALEALLDSVVREAEGRMRVIESHLMEGNPSARGLRSAAQSAQEVRDKVERYLRRLGVEQPKLVERCENLAGAVQAALLLAEGKR
jgi:hypothetical protein